MRTPSDRFMRDQVDVYPTTWPKGDRGGAVASYGDPVRRACAVQVAELSSRPVREEGMERRYGASGANILFAAEPPEGVADGTKIVHVASKGGDLSDPDVYFALGKPIPPGGGRARWTVAVARNA